MRLDLKKNYSSREVAAITGLSARQLQSWDARKLIKPSVAAHRTEAGGYTERRYSPVDLFELAALADLRRSGLSWARFGNCSTRCAGASASGCLTPSAAADPSRCLPMAKKFMHGRKPDNFSTCFARPANRSLSWEMSKV
jgi:MerR HTH family regulatory protein